MELHYVFNTSTSTFGMLIGFVWDTVALGAVAIVRVTGAGPNLQAWPLTQTRLIE